MDKMTLYFLCYIGFLLVMSITAFILYGADKRKAKKNKWRIKESVLLGVRILWWCFRSYCRHEGFPPQDKALVFHGHQCSWSDMADSRRSRTAVPDE